LISFDVVLPSQVTVPIVAMTKQSSQRRSYPVAESISDSGVWAFESRHGAEFAMPKTSHPFPKLLLIREGSGKVIGDWGERDCKMGDCVSVPPKMAHRLVDAPSDAISLYGLGVSLKLFACVPGVSDELPFGVVAAQRLKSIAVEHRLRRILYLNGQGDKPSQLSCVAASLELFAELAIAMARATPIGKASSKDALTVDPMLEPYLTWLQHHFFEPVTLDAAANACLMSRRHFTTSFKQHVGSTWLEYVHRLRVEYAVDLLRNTDRKIASVAFQAGFDDITTFYRVVAKLTGKRPGELRLTQS